MEDGSMMGLGILLILAIWAGLSLMISRFLSKKLLGRFTTDETTGNTSSKGVFITLLLSVVVFFTPILDQLIAYPRWQQMCATTGDFEWGSNMDEKKAFGRDIIFVSERVTTTTIFPNIKIDYTGFYIYDAKTQELIFKKPHFKYKAEALIFMPSDSGDRDALFLPTCESHTYPNFVKTYQLNQLEYKAILK